MVWRSNVKVTTRPLHPFSLLVEFVKGGECSYISPPHAAPSLEPPAAPAGILLCTSSFGNFLRVHIRAVLPASGNIFMGALWPCILSVCLKIGFLQPTEFRMSSFENKIDLYLNTLDVTAKLSPLI